MDETRLQKTVDETIERGFHQLELEDFAKDESDDSDRQELGIEIEGDELTAEDYVDAYDGFVRNPSLQGIDSKVRIALLFRAIQKEIKNGSINVKTCGECGKGIQAERFSEEFISAYESHMTNTKTDITIQAAKTALTALQRRWTELVMQITGELVPLIDQYMSTEPKKLNSVGDFPYTITEKQIYHDRCVEDGRW